MSTKIQNRYELIEWLNEGGESIVYRALDHQTSKMVVIKRTKYGLPTTEQHQWTRETSLLKEIQHTKVVQLLDCFVHTIEMVDYGMMVFEYINGQTLEEEASNTRYTQQDVQDIILELLKIVADLQQLSPPILHRDIKPSNIIRDSESDELRLLDFGMATDYFPSDIGHTLGIGTLGYQAPEQIYGYPTLSSDVYSIGVIAVELLSKRKAKDLLNGHTIDWSGLRASIKPEWSAWLDKTLCPVEDRYQTATHAIVGLSEQYRRTSNPESSTAQTDRYVANHTSSNFSKDQNIMENQRIFWMCLGAVFLGMLPIPFILYYHYKRRQMSEHLS